MPEINTEYLQKCIDTMEKDGQGFVDETVSLVEDFLTDAKRVKEIAENAGR